MYAHAAKPTQDTPRIDECIQLFNGLTIWVVCSILKEHSAFRRADIIEKFIDTTKVCLSGCDNSSSCLHMFMQML